MTKILIRGGTAAEWAAENSVLAARELGVESDTAKAKWGDGVTAWNDLDYFLGNAGIGVTDGDKGDIIVTDGGLTWEVKPNAANWIDSPLGTILHVERMTADEIAGITEDDDTIYFIYLP